jgi:hypothetical protein
MQKQKADASCPGGLRRRFVAGGYGLFTTRRCVRHSLGALAFRKTLRRQIYEGAGLPARIGDHDA